MDQHLIGVISRLPNSPSAMDNSRMTKIPAKGFAINTIIPNAIGTAPSQEVLSLESVDTQFGTYLSYYSPLLYKVITPQARRSPAFPVFFDSASPPLPRSSSSLCITKDLPIIEFSPVSAIRFAVI